MKRTIEIHVATQMPLAGAQVGFHDFNGSLYVVTGQSVQPMWAGYMNQMFLAEVPVPVPAGISEATLLKAMAIANGSEWTKELVK